MAAGGWASALGAAILGGNRGYTEAVDRRRSRKFEDDEAALRATQGADAHAAALQAAILNQNRIDDLPRDNARQDVDAMLKLLGPEAAFNSPDFIRNAATAGIPIPTDPRFKELANSPLSNEAMADVAGNAGMSPLTGAQLPADVLAAKAARATTAQARAALMSGQMGPGYQKAFMYEQAGGKNPPAGLVNDGANWVVEKMTDPMTGAQSLVRVNKATGERGPIQGGASFGAGQQGAPAGQDVSGEEFLRTLPDPIQRAVKQMAEYKAVLPSGAALRSPYWQNLLTNLVPQYDPNFNAQMYRPRQQMLTDWTSGKMAANKRSLNQAIKHLATLDEKARALDNFSTPVVGQLLNYGKNAIANAGDDPRVNDYNLAANAVENEAATMFKGTSGTDQEIKSWRAGLSPNMGPEKQASAIRTLLELLNGRVSVANKQWEDAMGIPPKIGLIDPDSQAIMDRLSKGQSQFAAKPQQGPAPQPPPIGSGLTYADYVARKQGKR